LYGLISPVYSVMAMGQTEDDRQRNHECIPTIAVKRHYQTKLPIWKQARPSTNRNKVTVESIPLSFPTNAPFPRLNILVFFWTFIYLILSAFVYLHDLLIPGFDSNTVSKSCLTADPSVSAPQPGLSQLQW